MLAKTPEKRPNGVLMKSPSACADEPITTTLPFAKLRSVASSKVRNCANGTGWVNAAMLTEVPAREPGPVPMSTICKRWNGIISSS